MAPVYAPAYPFKFPNSAHSAADLFLLPVVTAILLILAALLIDHVTLLRPFLIIVVSHPPLISTRIDIWALR